MKEGRKGFTLIELLIVIVVIGILAAMMMMAADEFVASSKASNIVANLTTLKKVTLAWYMENLEKVADDGRVVIITNPKKAVTDNVNVKPIQEWSDSYLHISGYISNMGATGINLNPSTKTVTYSDGTTKTNTNMAPGYYGVCDGGGNNRTTWYVGYCFKEGEDAVKRKVAGKVKSHGLMFGTADAHENKNEDNSAAVWLKVLSLK